MSIYLGESKSKQIRVLYHKGLSIEEIARRCNCSQEAVNDVLDEYEEKEHSDNFSKRWLGV